METATTTTTFTTRPEAAARIALARQLPEAIVLRNLAGGQVYCVGRETFTDNGAGMVKVDCLVIERITVEAWKGTHRDYKTGDPRKGTAKVLRLTDRGTCLVPVEVVG